MYWQNYRHKQKSSFVLCCIFILSLILGSATIYAEGNTIVLNGPNESANKTFEVSDMFPGDKFSQDYELNISHEEDIEVFFKVRILDGYEDDPEESGDLAEVLEFKVEIPGEKVLYNDGQDNKKLMKDMPEYVSYVLPASQKKVKYRLTVSLDTSVGDDYQNKELKADFEWYYMPESSGGGGSAGGSSRPGVGTTKLLRRAYVIGRPGDLFHPEAPITRAETVTIFARIFADYDENNLVSTDTKFKDVKDTDWFAKYISRCEDENIIFGYENDFRPSDNITRAEFAAICVRFFENRSGSVVQPVDISFTDFESSHWAYDSIKKAYANGYVAGYPDGTLKADNTITRAEAVTIVNRMLERVPDKEYIDNNLHKLIDFQDVRDNEYWAYYEIFEAANTHYIRFVNNFAKWVD